MMVLEGVEWMFTQLQAIKYTSVSFTINKLFKAALERCMDSKGVVQ